MMKRLFLIIAFWAAGVAGASAQMRLTLPQALDLALSENPTVKVAEMEAVIPCEQRTTIRYQVSEMSAF